MTAGSASLSDGPVPASSRNPAVSESPTSFSGGPGEAGSSARGLSYRDLLDGIDQGFCIIEMVFDEEERPVDYRFLEVNAAFESETGLKNATGRTMRSLEPGHEDYWFALYGHVASTGEPVRFERPAEKLDRHYDVYAFRVGPPHLRRVAVLFSDITGRKREEERLALISAEIDHRAKNLFSVVSSLVRRTQAETVDAFRRKLSGRINSLARSHRLLSGVQAADLAELVGQEVACFGSDGEARITWQGPDVRLPRATAQLIGLVLHELATNAVKYGSLSVADGRLDVSWSWRDDGRLDLTWVEADGPAVQEPTSQGMGTDVIFGAIEHQLGGKVRFEWPPQGLRCALSLPAGVLSDQAPQNGTAARASADQVR